MITLRKRFCFDILIKYNQQRCYNFILNIDFLAIDDWKITKQHQCNWKNKLKIIVIIVAYVIFFIIDITTSNINFILLTIFINANVFAINIKVSIIFIDLTLKYILFNNVIVYNESNVIIRITKIINVFFTIWSDQKIIVDIFENQWMSITLKSNVKFKSIKIYSINIKDREIINIIFDKMHIDNKIT